MTTETTETKNRSFAASTWQMTLMGVRYLNGRKLRTVLTTLAIVFGVALIFSINLVLPSVVEAFQQTISSVAGADLSIGTVTGASFAPEAALEQISAMPEVRAVTGMLRRQYTLPASGSELGSAASIELVGVDPATVQAVQALTMSEGRFIAPGDENVAVLPGGIAEMAPQLTVGSRFPLVTAGGLKIFTLIGLTAEQGSPSAPQMYVTLADAQAAFGQPGLINTVEIALNATVDREAAGAAIVAALGEGFAIQEGTRGTEAFAAMEVGFAVMNMFGFLALFLGAFLIFNTFRTVVVERRRDLAMLRAIGATQRQITSMILIESLLQGVIGTVIGLITGYLLAAGLVSAMAQLYSAFLNMSAFTLHFSIGAVVIAAVMGILTALLAGYLPARAAGRTTPLEALRPATVASVQKAARWSLIAGAALMGLAILMLLSGSKGAVGGAMLFLIGMVVAAPGLVIPAARLFSPMLSVWFAREGDLAAGNLTRQPGRAAITGSTLMIGLATLVLMAATVTALDVLINDLTNRNFSSDVLLMPGAISIYNTVLGADDSLAEQVRALPEVETVGTLRFASSRVDGTGVEVLGIDPVTDPQIASFDFAAGDEAEAYAALGSGRSALVTSIAQRTLGLEVGDEMVMQTANGPQTYRVAGVANDLLSFKLAAVFISQDNLAVDFNKTEDIMFMINLVEGADEQAALAGITAAAADYPQFTPHLTSTYRDDMKESFSGALVMLYGLAFLILIPAALGLLNTLTINVLERTREIAMVRAVGGSRRQIRRIVTGEALLLGIFGSALGVLAGVAMSYGFISAFAIVGWEVPYTVPVVGMIAAVVTGVVLALFAAVLPARSAARLDIIRALQYE